jgi:hypothetical protein
VTADDQSGSPAYETLRGQALGVVDLGMPVPENGSDVYGLVVDIPGEEPGTGATVVAMHDGTSSVYSSGASFVGAGGYPEVREANRALLAVVAAFLPAFDLAAGDAFPPGGTVRIHVIRADGRHAADIPADTFWSPRRPAGAGRHGDPAVGLARPPAGDRAADRLGTVSARRSSRG